MFVQHCKKVLHTYQFHVGWTMDVKCYVVGVTGPMDPHANPALSGVFTEFQAILSKDSAVTVSVLG